MYIVSVTLLLLVLPGLSTLVEALTAASHPNLMALIGKWFTFWAVGVRLFTAGTMQVFRPQFTSKSIFQIEDDAAFAIVREVGFGNLAMGTLGLASLIMPEWRLPAAMAGGLYYGLAGAGHIATTDRNAKEQFALFSDIGIFLLLAVFVVWPLI